MVINKILQIYKNELKLKIQQKRSLATISFQTFKNIQLACCCHYRLEETTFYDDNKNYNPIIMFCQ